MSKRNTIILVTVLCLGVFIWFAQKKYVSYNSEMRIKSPAFEDGGKIPSRYTCDGEELSPELIFQEVPKEAHSLALIVDDPDTTVGTWDHFVLWNISPSAPGIEENSVPKGAVVGQNSWPKNEYGGPCPPEGSHRYFFKLYALDTAFNLPATSGSTDLQRAMGGHILAEAELMGKYERQK